jgi:hypothetical protein
MGYAIAYWPDAINDAQLTGFILPIAMRKSTIQSLRPFYGAVNPLSLPVCFCK